MSHSWTFPALSGPRRRFSAETFNSPALKNRDDERQTCRMPLYHHHQIVSFGLLASITARSRKKIRKMGGGPRNYYSLICFRARSPDLNFGPASSSTRRRSHGFSRKLLMHRQQLRLNFRETTCQLWLLILHADPWLSDFPCSSWFWIIFPWNLRRSTVSQIGARRFGDEIFGQMHFALIAFWGKNNEFVSIVESRSGEIDRSMSVIIIHPMSKIRESPKNVCIEALLILFRMLKFRFVPETWWIWLFWLFGGARRERRGHIDGKESPVSVYTEGLLCQICSYGCIYPQSVKLFLNFHDLYFYI